MNRKSFNERACNGIQIDITEQKQAEVHPTVNLNVVIGRFRGDIHVKGSGRKYDNRYVDILAFSEAGPYERWGM